MAKKQQELDFLINDTAWKLEKVSTNGAKLKPIQITSISIYQNNIRYEYAGEFDTGFFFTANIGETVFATEKEAMDFCNTVCDKYIDCDYQYIFFAIRKHITNFENFSRFHIRLRHTINTLLSYAIIDKCDAIDIRIRSKATVDGFIKELTETDIEDICSKNGILFNYLSGVCEVSPYSHISNHNYDTVEECYTIDAWETEDQNEEGKVIAKVYKTGILMFMPEVNHTDPKLCEAIEDLLVNKL